MWLICVKRLSEANIDQRVSSIDGIRAFDNIRRAKMLRKLHSLRKATGVLPFVRRFYGRPSTYLWEDDEGVNHDIAQGRGAEQRGALTPSLFALGQHETLEQIHSQLLNTERIFAYLDDIYIYMLCVCPKARC